MLEEKKSNAFLFIIQVSLVFVGSFAMETFGGGSGLLFGL